MTDSDYDDQFCFPPKREVPVDGIVTHGHASDADVAELRALIKPLVLKMHKMNWTSIGIIKQGTVVHTSFR